MSTSMYLFCPETKLYVWIGQWLNTIDPLDFCFYSGEPDTMQKLRWFLSMHVDKALQFTSDTAFHDAHPDAIEFDRTHWETHVRHEHVRLRQWDEDKTGCACDLKWTHEKGENE